ncbi:putative membrane protein [Oopsacas minuta]|uniref:Transmembrane protein 107 n=1 Tax=Oopsacas minuta TaxID=111878 RepID=A0AAV7JWH0_9METZ|nr:putative membrane protein [Oopsacas minuta]
MIIPTRFLSLTVHLITTLSLFWSREPNLLSCIPEDVTADSEVYRVKDVQLVAGLCLMLALLLIEYAGFFSGLSLFNSSVSLISSFLHITACILLLFFQAQAWNCDTFWYVLAFCSIIPSLVEIVSDAIEIKIIADMYSKH